VERSFVLDVRHVLEAGIAPGTQGDLTLRATLVAWPIRARFLVRRVEELVVTLWFDHPVGGGPIHLPIDMPARGSHRRCTFVCPRPDHAADTPALVAKLYWPVGEPGGFACRRCHRLAYQSQQTRRGEPQWLRGVRVAANL